MEECFVGRSMISPASEEDEDVKSLSTIFKSILTHENFVEFSSSPIRRKVPPIAMNSNMTGKASVAGTPNMTQNEKRVKKLLDKIEQLQGDDQHFYLTKIDSISKEVDDKYRSELSSPLRLEKRFNNVDEEGRQAGEEDDFGKSLSSYKYNTIW